LIFYQTEDEKAKAERSRQLLNESGRYKAPVITEIRKFEAFYPPKNIIRIITKRTRPL